MKPVRFGIIGLGLGVLGGVITLSVLPTLRRLRDDVIHRDHIYFTAMARALAADPDLILCDEVTSALDTVVGAAVLDLIAELRRELGVSYLFISHDLHTVRAVCDEIVVMRHGRKLAQVARADYDRGPHHPYYEELARAVPELRRGWLDELDRARPALVA